MKLWTVRAGRSGQKEQVCLDESLITIGWDDISNVSSFKSREQLFDVYQKTYNHGNVKAGLAVGQIWRFANEIAIGDLVALPSKFQPIIHIGKVTGPYQYLNKHEVVHWRQVKWLNSIPRAAFDQDLLYSMGSLLTISQVSREKAAERVKALIEGKAVNQSDKDISVDITSVEEYDVERIAKDRIIKLINRKFKGHDFAKLVEQILQAQGYTTQLSPPGPDGGLDILAASGPLGFENPRICVQVKSTNAQVDVKVLRELQGVMRKVKAELGLLVSWSGFNTKVLAEAREEFFFIRLWNADDILENIFKHYDKFSDDFKAELPLKRFWLLVDEED